MVPRDEPLGLDRDAYATAGELCDDGGESAACNTQAAGHSRPPTLDLGGIMTHLRYEVRRVSCPKCGPRVEAVPWAEPGSGFTFAFERHVAFLAKETNKTTVTELMRIAWRTVGRIKPRCRWCATAPEFLAYHDREWGFPVGDDQRPFEKLSLEGSPSAAVSTTGGDVTTPGPTTGADPVCGNGVVEDGEDCDDGGESTRCNDDCTPAACGDGLVNATAGELCDDGGEWAACNLDCTPAVCGDGLVNAASLVDADRQRWCG